MADRDEERRRRLFSEFVENRSVAVRNELVESYAPLAEYFANRYKNRTHDHEDLRQVAQLALVKAVDRFDPEHGAAFSTFAGRTIDGELKRHFRDRAWVVRVPRSLQEASLEVRQTADRLATENGRAATLDDLVDATGYGADVVLEALDVSTAQYARSIDHPAEGETDGPDIASALGADDDSFERTNATLTVRSLMENLPEREREIVELRFFGELTQQEIADRLGISQMHVSRLIRSALESLRHHLH